MIRLPLLGRDFLHQMLTADIPAAALEKPAVEREIRQAIEWTFGPGATLTLEDLHLPADPRVRDVYAAIIETDQFRAACGRISASYAW